MVRSGALVGSAPGDAIQEGRLGQTIQVQNSASKKVLTARVTGPATVEVELGGVP
jgi:flagella basal body P-ring formation protein FlgA